MSPKHQVGCYYFPNYHVDARNELSHGPGWSEWELVKHATPRFPGHHQPNVPLWGHEMENDPTVMARKIDAAADHGIDFFIFDWYYYDDGPYLERGLEEGYLRAPNNDRVKFCCMWANHDWINIHPCGRTFGRELMYPGKVTPETFRKICNIFVERYFSHPSHFQVKGCPYFSIYDLNQFLRSFGSVAATRAALEEFRAMTQAAGFPDLHLNLVVWNRAVLPGEETLPEMPKLIRELGFDSTTSYVWIHHVGLNESPGVDFDAVRDGYFGHWERMVGEYDVPYYPNVTMGWDSSPRTIQSDSWFPTTGYPNMNMIRNNTPEKFREALAKTRDKLDQLGGSSILNINCWNEWTEGSYLEPDQKNGLAYLQAVKDVFGAR